MHTRWGITYNEAIRMLDFDHTEKELRQIKSLWVPTMKEFGLSDTITEQIDLIMKTHEYLRKYETCVTFIDNLIHNYSFEAQNANLVDFQNIFNQNKDEAFKRIQELQITRNQLNEAYSLCAKKWQTHEKLYKEALVYYLAPNYRDPEVHIMAMKLTYKDRIKLDSHEQIEMCYYLAKTERKSLLQRQKNLPSAKFATKKLMNYIIKNQQFLNYAKTKKPFIQEQTLNK